MNEYQYVIILDGTWSSEFSSWLNECFGFLLNPDEYEHCIDALCCYLYWRYRGGNDIAYIGRIRNDIVQGFHLDVFDDEFILNFFLFAEKLYSQISILSLSPTQSVLNVSYHIEDVLLKALIIHFRNS